MLILSFKKNFANVLIVSSWHLGQWQKNLSNNVMTFFKLKEYFSNIVFNSPWTGLYGIISGTRSSPGVNDMAQICAYHIWGTRCQPLHSVSVSSPLLPFSTGKRENQDTRRYVLLGAHMGSQALDALAFHFFLIMNFYLVTLHLEGYLH